MLGRAHFNDSEKATIDKIYNIAGTLPKGGVVDRINSISWSASNLDNPKSLQYYGGNSIIRWNEIK